MQPPFVLATAILITGVMAIVPATGETISLKPVADTSIFAAAPRNNLGASASMAVGSNAKNQPGRGLLRFDVAAALPPGAVVTRASLAFSVMKDPPAPENSTFEVHRMLVAWTEGQGPGNLGRAAVVGETSWTNRIHPDVPWSAPGGTPGIDFATNASAVVSMLNEGRYEMEAPGLGEDVQTWINDPSSNFGWMLKNNLEGTAQTARRVATREDPDNAATLTIDYTLPLLPTLERWGIVEDRFEIEFRGEPGNIYEIQARNLFGEAETWSAVTNYIVKLVSTNITFTEPLSLSPTATRFFRLADVGDVD